MNLYWIFDLDYTLYTIDTNTPFDYNLLSEDTHLNFLLHQKPFINFPQFIFTNAMMIHAKKCLSIMKLPTIQSIYSRDMMNDLKPNISAFNKFMEYHSIEPNDVCIFFEDSLENLKQAKELGWITIYIGQLNNNYTFIDMHFPNIYKALDYFYVRFNK